MSLLLSGLCGFASAQTGAPATPSPAMAAAADAALRKNVDLATTHTGFDCSPTPIGAGTWPTLRSNPAGSVIWWYCPTAKGDWRVNWAAATTEQLSLRNVYTEFRAVLAADDPKVAFDAAVARNVRVPINSPALTAVWHPFISEMNAGKPRQLSLASVPARAPIAGAAPTPPSTSN